MLKLVSHKDHEDTLGLFESGLPDEIDEQHMEDKLKELQEQTKGYQTRRFQELLVSFLVGGITLVVGLYTFRTCTKAGTIRYEQTSRGFTAEEGSSRDLGAEQRSQPFIVHEVAIE